MLPESLVRPRMALTLLGAEGARRVAALRLRWSDLDLRRRVHRLA
jgi:integrase